MRLADYVMKFLVGKGVKHLFMLPGGGAMHLDDALGRCSELDYTCVLHEQAAAIASEAYGQFTNTPGVALVTSGPGGTNTITGVTAAYFDSTPCLFISGQAKRADLKGDSGVRQKGSQEVDLPALVSPITKYAVTVMEPETIRFHLEKAWHLATTGRKGPVWIEVPLDVQGAPIDEDSLAGFTPEPEPAEQRPSQESINEVISALNRAKRPVLLLGNGVKLANCQDDLISMAEALKIPLLTTWKSIDLLDYAHPLNFGCPGIMGSRFSNFIVQNADLLLAIGSRLEPSLTAFDSKNFGKHAFKIMVDIDVTEIRKIEGIDLAVTSNAKAFTGALTANMDQLKCPSTPEWLEYCQCVKAKYPVMQDAYKNCEDGINLYAFTDLLFTKLTNDDIIVPESSGSAGEVTYQAMKIKHGQKVKNAAGLGSMGFGLPYSIGACLAMERRRTILFNGDGAFQLNLQELETVRRLGLPIKMFIFDNDGYASIRATQDKMFEGFHVASSSASGLTLPDLGRLARAYDIRFEECASYNELPACLDRCLTGTDPVICRVKVSPSQVTAPRVQSLKRPDGSMESKPLEDMWPYLPAEEIKQNMIAEDRGQRT